MLTDGTLRVTRNGTALVTTTKALSAGVYYHIGWRIKIDPSVGETQIWLNGASILNQGSLNSRATANSTANQVGIGSTVGAGATQVLDWSDTVIKDLQGSASNSFLGDVGCYTDFADADGASSDWTVEGATNDFEAVDEATPDDDTTYIHSATADQRCVFRSIPRRLREFPVQRYQEDIAKTAKGVDKRTHQQRRY